MGIKLITEAKQLLKTLLFKKSFILLLISLSIPLALSGSLISIPNTLNINFNSTNQYSNISVSLAVLKKYNESYQVNVFSNGNETNLLKSLNIELLNGKYGVLVSNNLNVSLNDTINLCFSNSCNTYHVTGIISSPYNLNIIILPNLNTNKIEVKNGIQYILGSTKLTLNNLSLILSIILISLSLPAIYFSNKKMYNSINDAINYLKNTGSSKKDIKTGYIISSLIISVIFVLYGFSLGIVIYQLGLTIVYHLNFPYLTSRLPSISSFLIIFFYSIMVSFISSFIQVYISDCC
ncbi:MAG: hypothetical protein ACP5M8_06910 [Caldisphaera sp.]